MYPNRAWLIDSMPMWIIQRALAQRDHELSRTPAAFLTGRLRTLKPSRRHRRVMRTGADSFRYVAR